MVSTYELGHQPLAAATTAAALIAAGHEVRCCDVAVDALDGADVAWAEGLALSVPMHTAMRLARRVAAAARSERPELPVCYFGLYATAGGAGGAGGAHDAVVAGEFEGGVVRWAGGEDPGPAVQLGRVEHKVPERTMLPELGRYTKLVVGADARVVGSVATTRGCSHHCRHCPVPVVYGGRVRPVPVEVVLADVDQLVAAGASHVSFADPDFLNMPGHARRVLEALHDRHPEVSFDATMKVEHLLKHRAFLPELASAGCAFVVSAFESVNDEVLSILDKGHSAEELSEVVVALREVGLEVRPSWLPFTPWTTYEELVGLMDFVIAHDLVANVDPVQYSVRLLVPEGSLLLHEAAMSPHLGAYDPEHLGWQWAHEDPSIDELQERVAALVEARAGEEPEAVFTAVDAVIRAAAGAHGCRTADVRPRRGALSQGPPGPRAHLSEPWFCCAEPTQAQLATLA